MLINKELIMITEIVRKKLSSYFTGQKEIIFNNNIPSFKTISEKISEISNIGLYLHIPFCNKICPYCPYNKELYNKEIAVSYTKSLKKEIQQYSLIAGNIPITSFYIGGGTPSSMLNNGIIEIIEFIYDKFNMQCDIHMECHPNHISDKNLDIIESVGVKYLSIGVESLQDHHLKNLERPYTVNEVKQKIEKAVNRNFKCVNVDYIFDLPNQTIKEIEQDLDYLAKSGINQVATYPLFNFPYTKLGKDYHKNRNAINTMFKRRKFLKIIEDRFYQENFYRSSVWAFTQSNIEKYCSVTVPKYLGLGASGSTYLNDIFYVNTFSVKEYIKAINKGSSPISLSVDLSKKMQMSGWLYWRIYETKFCKSDFEKRFNVQFDETYGRLIKTWERLGYLKNGKDEIKLTDKGTYWIHAFEDFFSINYITKLWGTSQKNPWPEKIIF